MLGCAGVWCGPVARDAGGGHTQLHQLECMPLWNPWQRILSIFVVMDSPSSKVSTLEAHRERAYSPAEVGGWLMDGGFLIRAVHDAITLRMATG
jgi:hypothetical protein